MLKIAICDDEQKQLSKLEALVREYIAEKELETTISCFSHPDKLLLFCEKESFHIYILDIVMPMVDGVELGLGIRRLDREAQIIYATTESGFALDAYAANPINYLLKPIDRSALFATLDLAMEKMKFGEEQSLTVKTREGLRTISFDTILYCEYVNHKIKYILRDEQIETTSSSESFAEHIASLLADKRFLSPHSAYAVNMHFVERLDKNGFTIRGGHIVPVSSKQYTAVRNAYMNYRMGD